MSWPQYIVLAWWLFAFGHVVHGCCRAAVTSAEVTLRLACLALLIALQAVVLHAGGFW